MTYIKCDLCDKIVDNSVRVEFRDGEHPHNGSTMTANVDVCCECIKRVPKLSSRCELDELKNKLE